MNSNIKNPPMAITRLPDAPPEGEPSPVRTRLGRRRFLKGCEESSILPLPVVVSSMCFPLNRVTPIRPALWCAASVLYHVLTPWIHPQVSKRTRHTIEAPIP